VSGKDMLRTVGLAGLTVFGLGLWLAGPALKEARMAAAFAARQTCACVHISARGLDACVADLPGDGAGASFQERDTTVRASIAGGLIAAEATYEEGFGCILD
jgi:hypothetical protein